jgi:hypothetical protein
MMRMGLVGKVVREGRLLRRRLLRWLKFMEMVRFTTVYVLY